MEEESINIGTVLAWTTQKVTLLKGEMPGPMATEWWTKEDWDAYYARVEELKASGEYLKPEEYTFEFQDHPAFVNPKEGALSLNCFFVPATGQVLDQYGNPLEDK